VLVLTYYTSPTVFGALRGRAPTVVYSFAAPLRVTRRVDRVLSSRKGRSPAVHVVVCDDELARRWAKRVPDLPVSVLRIAGVDPRDVVDDPATRVAMRASARARLGLGAEERIALLFGAGHPEQDPEVVARAFADPRLHEFGLVAAGRIADQLGDVDGVRLAVPGFVSMPQRDDLFAAADLVVLSFRDGHVRDSATLTDAIARGLPVVVSGNSTPAELVVRFGLGVVFAPSDVDALVGAVLSAPAELDTEVIRIAQAEMSYSALARDFLALVGADRTGGAREVLDG
jgi:glycosyltransferase involved in cell wall biosynthesis